MDTLWKNVLTISSKKKMWMVRYSLNQLDYKVKDKTVRAKLKQSIDRLPEILIIHLKRFIYKGKAIKMKEEVEIIAHLLGHLSSNFGIQRVVFVEYFEDEFKRRKMEI
jgi:hypothetical protein